MQTSLGKKKIDLCLKQYKNAMYLLINESCFCYISGCEKSCLRHIIEPSMLNFININWVRFYNSISVRLFEACRRQFMLV